MFWRRFAITMLLLISTALLVNGLEVVTKTNLCFLHFISGYVFGLLTVWTLEAAKRQE